MNIELLRECGRLVLIGLMGGRHPTVDLVPLLSKRLTVIGSVLRSRPLEQKVALIREFGRRVLPLIAAGKLRPVVDRRIDWSEIAEAHEVMERNENFGKIVLTVHGD